MDIKRIRTRSLPGFAGSSRVRRAGADEVSSAQLRAIFESALDAILVTDGAGRYTAANPAAGELLGLPPREIVGKTVADFSVAVFDVDEAWSRFLEAGRQRGDFLLRRADGEIRHVEFAAVAGIAPNRHLSILRDVTDAKRNEETLRRISAEKDQFLAVLSHELRNPISAVSNAVQILQTIGPPEPRLKSARNIIERQISHLTRLVDDLLDLSRINFGKAPLRSEPIDAREAVDIGLETMRPSIDARKQVLIVGMPPDPLRLNGDRNRLAQVVSNLVHNASRFSADGARIWLELGRAGQGAILRVRDEGVGIPGEKLQRVFDAFAQFEPSRRDRGLGLGLTLVRTLVELHGGTVEVSSAGPGQGSEFVVRLPAVPSGDDGAH